MCTDQLARLGSLQASEFVLYSCLPIRLWTLRKPLRLIAMACIQSSFVLSLVVLSSFIIFFPLYQQKKKKKVNARALYKVERPTEISSLSFSLSCLV